MNCKLTNNQEEMKGAKLVSTCKQQSKENRRLRIKLSPMTSFAIAGPVSKPVKEKTTELHSFKLRRIRQERAQSWDVSEAEVYNAFLRVRSIMIS